MKGDYTRFSHEPSKRYSAVLRQQGRVDLDADWNEHVQIVQHLERTEAEDVIGPSGVPKPPGTQTATILPQTGFAIFDTGDGDLGIRPGRIYAEGLLCENHSAWVPIDFPTGSTDASPVVPAWAFGSFASGQLVEVRADGQSPVHRRVGTPSASDRRVPLSSGVGSGIATGANRRMRIVPTYARQPDLPAPPARQATQTGRYDLVYLDVWQRHVSAVEDPDIREQALGGPDTATRLKTVWQVRILRGLTTLDCDAARAALPRPGGGRLSSSPVPVPPEDDPCFLVPEENYRGVENRLYRVEIHKPGAIGTATFKWSRDNGSVAYEVERFEPGEPRKVKLRRLGRDRALSLHRRDWVEVVGDTRELAASDDLASPGTPGTPGTLAQVVDIDTANRVVELDRDVTTHSGEARVKLRRWDHPPGAVSTPPPAGDITLGTAAHTLEAGIQVRFSGSDFRAGDYWVFRTRAATGFVESLVEAPPRGTQHRYLPLALIRQTTSGSMLQTTVERDCRRLFPALAHICAEDVCVYDEGCTSGATNVQEALDKLCGQRTLRYVGGDGQEATPGGMARGFLEVGVEDGMGRRVAGAQVAFVITAAGGTPAGQLAAVPVTGQTAPVDPPPGGWQAASAATPVVATTDAQGVARVQWKLGGGRRAHNEVRATLHAAPPAPLGPPLPIYFRALSEATALNLRHVGGDGQEGAPGEQLPCELVVGVEDEEGRPRAGVRVNFAAGAGTLTGTLPAAGPAGNIPADTNADGLARVRWTLGPDEGCQTVTATVAAPPQGGALRELFEAHSRRAAQGGGNCTVTIEPGDDIAAAIARIVETGGKLCLAAGVYTLPEPVLVRERMRLVICGAGPATILRPEGEAALLFQRCSDIEVRHLRIEAGRGNRASSRDPGLNGGLTFEGCDGVVIADCEVACPDSFSRLQSCVTVRSAADPTTAEIYVGERSDHLTIERNRFEVGAWQVGALLIDPRRAVVRENRLGLVEQHDDRLRVRMNDQLSPEIGRVLASATRPEAGEDTETLRIRSLPRLFVYTGALARPLIEEFARFVPTLLAEAGGDLRLALEIWLRRVLASATFAARLSRDARAVIDQLDSDPVRIMGQINEAMPSHGVSGSVDVLAHAFTIHAIAGSRAFPLLEHFADNITLAELARSRSLPRAIADFGRRLAARRGLDALSPNALAALEELLHEFLVVGQGIVVAGHLASTIRVEENLIEDTVQGIHVGVGREPKVGRPVGELMVARNVIHARVPTSLRRDRHGIFVGNLESAHIVDTVASLERTATDFSPETTPVEGIRVFGLLGPFLAVRQTSLRGFSPIGVRITPRNDLPYDSAGMWLVAETMAHGADHALEVHAAVERERNYPT